MFGSIGPEFFELETLPRLFFKYGWLGRYDFDQFLSGGANQLSSSWVDPDWLLLWPYDHPDLIPHWGCTMVGFPEFRNCDQDFLEHRAPGSNSVMVRSLGKVDDDGSANPVDDCCSCWGFGSINSIFLELEMLSGLFPGKEGQSQFCSYCVAHVFKQLDGWVDLDFKEVFSGGPNQSSSSWVGPVWWPLRPTGFQPTQLKIIEKDGQSHFVPHCVVHFWKFGGWVDWISTRPVLEGTSQSSFGWVDPVASCCGGRRGRHGPGI